MGTARTPTQEVTTAGRREGLQKALQPTAAPRPWLDQGRLPHPTEDAGVGWGGRIPGLRAGVLNCEDKGTLHSLCREDTGGLPNPELAFRLSWKSEVGSLASKVKCRREQGRWETYD